MSKKRDSIDYETGVEAVVGPDRAPEVVVEGVEKAVRDAEQIKRPLWITTREIVDKYPHYDPVVIAGLLRKGEIMNVISSAKRGKTWLMLDLAISVSSGLPWLGFNTSKGRVLYIDNELRPGTISERVKRVSSERDVPWEKLGISWWSMRGNLVDINQIREMVVSSSDEFQLIILDALYRVLPEGTREEDNAQMARVYNCLDQIATHTRSAVVIVHHSSKGSQGGKSITDVGSGAGALSRATDTHMTLRELDPDECGPHAARVDAVPRTFPEIAPKAVRFEYPIWVEFEADVSKLIGLPARRGAAKKKEKDPEVEAERAERDKMSLETLVRCLDQEGASVVELAARLTAKGFDVTKRTVHRLITDGVSQGRIEIFGKKGKANQYRLPGLLSEAVAKPKDSEVVDPK